MKNEGQHLNVKRLVFLDSLRGIAAGIVLYHHIFKINASTSYRLFGLEFYPVLDFISKLNVQAVLFFFILSGFSIGLSLRHKNINDDATCNEYFYKRFKRIFPIYIFALFVAVIAGALMNRLYLDDYSPYNLAGNLLFLQTGITTEGWFTPYGFNGPLWSLAFELFFYCFFPVVQWINNKFLKNLSTNLKFALLLLLCMVSFMVNKKLFVPYFLFLGMFPVWLLGYMASITYVKNKSYSILFTGCFLFGLSYLLIGKTIFLSNSLISLSQGLTMGSLFYFFVRNRQNRILIKSTQGLVRVLNYLFYGAGRGSYAIYALHYPLLMLLNYYQIALYLQGCIILLFVFLSIQLEEISVKWKLSFLKLNYSFFMPKGNVA